MNRLPSQAPKGRTSTAQANGLGPRARLFWQQALKGRNSVAGRTRTPAITWSVAFISPFQGLRTPTGVNFLTQAVGLGLCA